MTTPIGITIGLDGVQQTEAGLRRVVGGVDAVGISAKQTAAALRGVPAQFTDIITSLQGGQAPLTVFLQQGGQLKDMFGGAGNAARALGGYVVGLVNPFTVAAAAGVALAVAYNQGSKEADAYTKSIALTGNAAGVTTAQLQGMAGRVSDVVGTQAKASEVLAQLVGTGNVAKAALEQQAATSIRLERNVGIAVKDTVKEFAELGKEPVEAAKKLNERYNYLTAAVYEQIKALKDQGKTQEAVALSQDAYEKAMSNVATTLEGQLGTLERGWRNIADAAKAGWDAMLNVGRKSTMSDEIGRVRTLIENKQVGLDSYRDTRAGQIVVGEIDALKQKLGVMESDERMQRRGADAQAARTQAEKAAIAASDELQKVQGKGLTQQQLMNKELERYQQNLERTRAVNPTSPTLTPDAIARGERVIREQYKPKGGSGAASGGENEVAALRAQADAAEKYLAQLRATGAEVEKLTAGEQRAANIREELKTSITGTARAQKELALVEAERLGTAERATVTQKALIKSIEESEAAYRKVLDAITKTGDAYGTQADQQEAANASLGRSKTAIEEAALAQQQLYLANEKAAGPWDPARIKAMEYAIEQQERYVDALRGGDGKAINAQTDELLRSAEALAAVYADEAQLAGLSAVERGKTVALRQVELKYAKELAAIDRSSAKDDEKQRARDTALQAKMIEGQAAVSKVVEEDWARTSKTIGDTLSDYIMGGGKNAAQYLQRLFSTLVLQPTVQYGASALMGAFGMGPAAGGGAGGGGIMGLLSNGQSLYSGYTGLTSGQGILGGVGKFFGLGPSSPYAASAVGSYAAPTGTAMLNAPAASGMSGLAGAGAFAAVAAVVLNALGAFKSERKNGGGLMGTLGGGPLSAWEEWREGGTLFSGPSFNTFSPTAELDSQRAKLASLRESGQGNTQQAATLQTIIDNLEEQYGGLAEATAAQSKVIQTAFDAMRKSAGDMADTLGLSSEAARNFTTALGGEKGLALDGLKPEEQQAKLAEALATANNEIAQQLIGTWETTTSEITRIVSENLGSAGEDASIVYSELSNSITKTRYVQSEYAKEGEKAIDTLTRLSTSMGVVNETADALGIGMADASLAAAAAASNIVDAFGGLEAFTQTLGTYFSNFYSETEQKAATARQVARALGDAGFEVDPATLEGATRTGIRAFVESVGEQFGYESKQYVAAVQQANVLASITEALPATVQAIDTAAQTAQQAAQDAARAWQDITDALLGNRSSAEIDLLRAQGKQEEALAAERARAIVGYDAYQVSLYDGTQAIFRQIEAIDKATEARAREAESVANLFSALDGSASRFLSGDALSGFQSTRQSDQLRGLGFDVSASQILGATTDQVKAFTLAVLGMDSVSNDAKTALLQLSGSILDTKESAQQTAQQNALQGVDTAFAALQRSVSMQRGVLSETATELKSVFDLLKTNVRDLYGQVDGAAQAQAAKARDFISKALGAARTTGYLPDSQDLQDAIGSARSGIDATAFASKAEADFQRLVLANELRDLQEISGDQLTEAEKQIKALDSILANAQTQVDALRGIDQSVIKVETAVANLGTAIAGALGTGIKPAAGGTITAPSSRVEYGNSAVMAASGYVQSAVAAGDLMGIYQGAKANGLNSADAAYLLQLSGFDVSKEDVLAWVKSQGLPAFAGGGFHSGGLRVVGERGLEIEATGPSRIWNQQQIAAAMGGSNADLVAEVRLLRLEVAELRSAGDRTAANTGRSAEVLTSVKNGNSLVTAAAPTF